MLFQYSVEDFTSPGFLMTPNLLTFTAHARSRKPRVLQNLDTVQKISGPFSKLFSTVCRTVPVCALFAENNTCKCNIAAIDKVQNEWLSILGLQFPREPSLPDSELPDSGMLPRLKAGRDKANLVFFLQDNY